MANNPTVVIGSLNDEELKKSIDKLVNHVDQQLNYMVSSTKVAVMSMNKSLKSLGDTKIDFGGSADGGASRRSKAQNAETDAIEKTIAARDKQIKKNQEAATSFDNFAKAQQVAIRSASPSGIRNAEELQTMNIQLDLLRERLREARQQYSSFVALAAHATTTGDKGLFQYATDGVHRYEQEVRNLIPQIRTLQSGIQQMGDVIAPQGHTIQNYVNSLQKANPELAALNAQYKSGTSLLQEQATSFSSAAGAASRYTEEIKKQIAAITTKKDATKAFEQISLMPSNSMEEIKAKGEALVELVKKVKDTPLMSQSNVKLAEKMIGSLANQYRALKEEKEKVAQTHTASPATENQTRRSLEQEKQDLERLKALQEERRQQIIQTGIAAQQQARILRESIGQQMQSADYTKQVDYKELQNALTEMKNAYKQPIDSSIKKALEEDIAITQKALDIAKRYSMAVAGMGAVGVGGKAPTDTLAAYSAEAQRLAGIYKNLSAEERSASAGQGLKRKYQELSRTASQVRKELERPINLKDAMKGGESNIDDLAYKIQRLQSYKRGLDFKTQAGEIQEVDNKIKSLNAELNKYLATAKNVQSQNTALGRSWNYMKNRLAFYFTVGASTSFVKNLIEVRSQYEMNERALGILINSAERGTQIFNELSQMALVSPYTLIELSSAAKQLTAYDIAAKDVVDTTRRLADMAAAVGVPIERLTYALGQIKAYGYLNSRDARMFANAGIPLVKQLSDHYTELEGKLVSVADIYDRIKKKQIGYEDVTEVIYKMTDEGGKFFDFQAKMAETLKVQLANLTLAWNNMLNDMGESNQWLLSGGIGALKELFLQWENISRILTNVAVTFGIAKASMYLLNLAMGKGTLETIKRIGALEGVTAANYRDILSTTKLTAAQAKFLIATNSSNEALRKAIVHTGVLTKQQAAAAASSKLFGVNLGFVTRSFKALGLTGAVALQGLWTGVKSIGAALLSIATNPLFIAVTATMAVTDAIMYYNQVAEKTEELNKNIAKGAKEASEALSDFLKDTVNISNRSKAMQGILSASEGEKTWTALREQIELSSDAASSFITELLSIQDINERVAKGFDYAESIKDATNALAGLNAEALNVNQDSWGGFFGEGLAEDMEDYIEAVKGNIGWFKSFIFTDDPKKWREEAIDEIKMFADNAASVIKDRLGDSIYDPEVGAVRLKESVERLKKEVVAANPKIKNEVKKFFDVELDVLMAEKFKGVYDQASSIQQMFVEHIKRDSGAALKRLSDDILDTSKQLDDNVVDAIEKAWKKLQDELPDESQSLISELQKRMNENPLTLRVLLLEAGEQQIRDAIQKDYEKHFYDDVIGEKPQRPKSVGTLWGDFKGDYAAYAAAQKKHEAEMVEYNQKNAVYEEKRAQQAAKYGEFNKKNDETRAKWAKRISDYIKEQETQEKAALHTKEEVRKELGAQLSEEELMNDVRYAQAKSDADAAAANIKNAQAAYKYEHLYNEEKKKGGSQKDPMLDTLKETIDIIKKTQSEYDTLTKSGESSVGALQKVYGRYGKTLQFVNSQLRGFGLPEIDLSKIIKGKNPNDVVAFFKNLLQILTDKGLSNLERVKAVEVVIQEFGLKADTYNLDKITKGLNNELGKLKEEYELAVELDANPELGDMFADMFGINTSTLPKTFGDALDRAQIIINRKLAEMNITTPFDLMEGNIDSFAKSTGLDKDGAVIKELVSAQNAYRDMFKKNITETEKVLDEYIKKYGDYSDKIAEIEAGRLEKLKKLNEAYYTEEMRKRPEYVAKLNAIEQGASKEKQQVDFDDFKNSRYYTMMFENLDYISTKTIRDMRDRVRELIDTMNDLTPEQLKTLMSQYEKLEQKLVKRSPFKTLTKDLKEYFATSKERKAANQEFKNAQKEYDAQKKNVAALKEKYEQAKANSNTSKSRLDFLQIEIDGENEILKILKEQLDAAQKKADKYNLTAKLAKSEALQVAQVVGQNLQSLGELRDFMQEDLGVEFSDELNGLVDGLSKVGQGINKITSSAQSGDIVGVITGVGQTVYGLYDGIASIFGGGSARDKKITKAIEDSERAVKRLELAYKNLEYAIEGAYGAGVIGAKQAAIANKELQLVELQRQLQLEKSRDSKHRDEDRILELQGMIIDAKNEIKRSYQEIATELLGISNVGDAAMQFMDEYVEALRRGEDAQAAFKGSFKEMIASMIKQLFVTKVIGPQLEALVDNLNERLTQRSKKEADAYEKAVSEQTRVENMTDDELLREYFASQGVNKFNMWRKIALLQASGQYDDFVAGLRKMYENNVKQAKRELDKAAIPTIEDMDLVAQEGQDLLPLLEGYEDAIKELLKKYDLFIDDESSSKLSALQQGIQGITEDTAGALEAITNGISQQCYLQSDILIQIRDTVQGFDIGLQTASLAQILLQLQASYQVQMSIQGILEGVLNPSGRAFTVELVS